MGDTEEPPTKVSKFEMESQYLEGDVTEEGQEEWLSEGILTDDDYNPASQQSQHDNSDMLNQSLDETMLSDQSQELNQSNMEDDSQAPAADSNIEETLNNFENSQTASKDLDTSEEMEAFLIRKSDGKAIGAQPIRTGAESAKYSDDDGNDTDDLLRVLGDGDKKENKNAAKKDTESSDDDEYIFKGSKVSANLQAAKNALLRASACKAEPEDDDDVTDCSSDELAVVKKMYVKKPTEKNSEEKNSEAQPSQQSDSNKKNVASSLNKQNVASSLNKQNVASSFNKQNVAKPSRVGQIVRVVQHKPTRSTVRPPRAVHDDKPADTKPLVVVKKPPVKEQVVKEPVVKKPQQEEREEESKQQMMKPEEMDEEMLTDPDTDEDDESIYDELPSSDSEVLDEWFQLDIRAERAGDYIPLLGDKAYQLLASEKRRAKNTLESLKKSIEAVSERSKQQAEKLNNATATVAELDAMLKAA